jgi:hypothetical protein
MTKMKYSKAKLEKFIREETPFDDFSKLEADLNKCLSIVDNYFLVFTDPTIEDAWEDALEQITEQYGDSSETDLRCEILTQIFLNSIISKSTTQA